MKLKKLLLFVFTITVSFIFSQSTISGTIVDAETLKPIPNATVFLEGFEKVTSNSLGNFQIWNVPYGKYILKATIDNYSPYTKEISLDSDYKYFRIRMGEATQVTGSQTTSNTAPTIVKEKTIVHDTVVIEKVVYVKTSDSTKTDINTTLPVSSTSNSNEIPTLSLDDLNKDIDAIDGDENISGILNGSRDPFQNTLSFTLGSYRFRFRGLDNANQKIYINDIEMNDMGIGRPSWSQWGGLNDQFKNRTSTLGLDKTSYTLGGLAGNTNIDIRPSAQRKGLKLSYAFSNRSYMHRGMATYNSGVMKGGWAFSFSGSYRFADNSGEINDKIRFNQFGTTYQAFSWFGGIEKQFGKNHNLALMIFGANNKRGKNGPATQEIMDLAGSNYYNPYWGWQTEPDGKRYKRNSRTTNLYIPTGILTHRWKINSQSKLTTSVAFRKGKNGSSSLDWRDANDPRPDYYRNMPSYAGLVSNQTVVDNITNTLSNNEDARQINWDQMYETNRMNTEIVYNPNGTDDTTTYNLAQYVLADRRYDPMTMNFSTNYENNFNDNITFNLGVNYAKQETHNYQILKDLLGAENYIDINKFAARDFPGNDSIAQNDLNRFNRIIGVGDKFGYDYTNHIRKSGIWAQTSLKFKHIDFFIANDVSFTYFWREGHVKNGFFPDNSEGNSEVKNFVNFNIKGGLTYKVNGRNYLFANGSFGTRAPYIRNAMLSPRTRNDFVPNLVNEKLYSVEGGYILKAPKLKARAVAYAIWNKDKTSNRGVYIDDARTFGTYIQDNIDTRNWGFELMTEIEAFSGFTITPVVAWGDHTYTSRPKVSFIKDNDNTPVFENRTLYTKGLHVANGPQAAYTLGLGYRTSSYWFFNVNFSYFDKIYIEASPERRTAEALDNVEKDSQLWKDMLSQERRKGQFVIDASIGKSLRLKDKSGKNHYLNFNLNVGNITHNTKFVTGGFEQYRFVKSDGNLDRFQNKYFYARGINFYFGVGYRF